MHVSSRLRGVSMAAGVVSVLAGCATRRAAFEREMVVTPIEQAKFTPINPANPDGAAIAVLWGDRTRGPFSMLLKLKKGPGQLHVHSADYHLIVLRGTMKHWGGDSGEREAAVLEPGSYWYQPGNLAHADACLSDECVMFVKFNGKHDGRLVESPRPT